MNGMCYLHSSYLITVDSFKNFLVGGAPSFVDKELGPREACGLAQGRICIGWEAWAQAQL